MCDQHALLLQWYLNNQPPQAFYGAVKGNITAGLDWTLALFTSKTSAIMVMIHKHTKVKYVFRYSGSRFKH